MNNLNLFIGFLVLTNIVFSQSGNFTTEITELEENFKLVKIQHTSGSFAEYLYEGSGEDIEIALLENADLMITGNGRDSYSETLWLPDEKGGIMPSDMVYFWLMNKVIIYGGRRISFIDAADYSVDETITISNSGSLSDMSFMPISPYRHQLSFAGEYENPLLVCATVGGELVVLNPFSYEIVQTLTDDVDSPILSASIKFDPISLDIIWVLNYWDGFTILKRYLYNNGEYQFANEETWNNQIIDFSYIPDVSIIVAMQNFTLELDPITLDEIFTYDVVIDKIEMDIGQPLFGHVKGEKKIVHIGGSGNLTYIEEFPIDYAFGSCYDKTNDIVYFTGIDTDQSKFMTVNYCQDCQIPVKSNSHVAAIDPAYNLNHTNSPSYYTVACAGKFELIGYDNEGNPFQSVSTEHHHGYRMVIDLSLDDPARIGGVIACLKDGLIKLFKSYWCEYDQSLTYLTTGISCSNSCFNSSENNIYFFYLGDGNNSTFSSYNESNEEQNIHFFTDEGHDVFGRVLDCVYNEVEEKVFAAFRDDYKDKNFVYEIVSSSAENHTENLGGIPELLLDYDDKIYCAAYNYILSTAYLYKIDAGSLDFEVLIYPENKLISLEKNPDNQFIYAIREGSSTVIQVDQDFVPNTFQTNSDNPKDICYNPIESKIYIADYDNMKVDIYNPSFVYQTSVSVYGRPIKIEFNKYQNNLYVISDNTNMGFNYVSVIDCSSETIIKNHEIRKSDGMVYDKINDQLYLQTNYPADENSYELNVKALNNFDDEFSNIVGTENNNYSDIMINKKRLVQSKPSFNQKLNKLYFGNYSISSASIINAYEETFTYRPGWNWLSFPRLERYQNNIFDSKTLLSRIDPWAPDYLEMIYEPDEVEPKFIEFIYGLGWNDESNLTEVQSSQGYQLEYIKNIPDFELRLEGAKLDYNTKIDLVTGANWVGYFLDDPMYPEECLPADLWDDLTMIKTQYWSMSKVPSGPDYWFIKCKVTPFEYGDLVILQTNNAYEDFQWQKYGEKAEPSSLPVTSYYSYEEQADYTPFYVETDSTSEIQEIAVLADGEVKGAAVREPADTIVEVNGYLEGVDPGAVIEFETWNGYKSSPVEKNGYVVIDHFKPAREKRSIYAGEKAGYYHVSLKSKEVFELPPDISFVSCQPNPFKQNIEFSFRLNRESHVSLEVFDMAGSLVKTIIKGTYPEGHYNFTWPGDNDSGNKVKPRVYFYRAGTENGTVLTDKLVLVK